MTSRTSTTDGNEAFGQVEVGALQLGGFATLMPVVANNPMSVSTVAARSGVGKVLRAANISAAISAAE